MLTNVQILLMRMKLLIGCIELAAEGKEREREREREESAAPVSQRVQLLDMKRANNASILLAQFRLSFTEIANALLDFDEEKLTVEQLISLKYLYFLSTFASRCLANSNRKPNPKPILSSASTLHPTPYPLIPLASLALTLPLLGTCSHSRTRSKSSLRHLRATPTTSTPPTAST